MPDSPITEQSLAELEAKRQTILGMTFGDMYNEMSDRFLRYEVRDVATALRTAWAERDAGGARCDAGLLDRIATMEGEALSLRSDLAKAQEERDGANEFAAIERAGCDRAETDLAKAQERIADLENFVSSLACDCHDRRMSCDQGNAFRGDCYRERARVLMLQPKAQPK